MQTDTSLYNGRRVRKDDARIEACGTLDELNSHIGLLCTMADGDLRHTLHDIQRRLFAIGARVAGYADSVYLPGEAEETELLLLTRRLSDGAGKFRGFVLPGGCPAAACTHICRTVCRRAERCVVACGTADEVVPYLNRLSGYLYALAGHFNRQSGTEEIFL